MENNTSSKNPLGYKWAVDYVHPESKDFAGTASFFHFEAALNFEQKMADHGFQAEVRRLDGWK